MQKTFNFIIIVFAYILCVLSLIAFIFIHIDLAKRSFQFNLEGINNYFTALTEFKELFTGTITLIVAYYGIQRFQAAEDANKDRIKLDRYTDWKNITETRMNEIKERNPNFSRVFSRLRFNLYNDLYEKQMAIYDNTELKKIYDKYFQKSTAELEKTSSKYLSMGGIYPDKESAYFFDDFYIVFIDCLDSTYENIYDDIKSLYLQNMDGGRVIDVDNYYKALAEAKGQVSDKG